MIIRPGWKFPMKWSNEHRCFYPDGRRKRNIFTKLQIIGQEIKKHQAGNGYSIVHGMI